MLDRRSSPEPGFCAERAAHRPHLGEVAALSHRGSPKQGRCVIISRTSFRLRRAGHACLGKALPSRDVARHSRHIVPAWENIGL